MAMASWCLESPSFSSRGPLDSRGLHVVPARSQATCLWVMAGDSQTRPGGAWTGTQRVHLWEGLAGPLWPFHRDVQLQDAETGLGNLPGPASCPGAVGCTSLPEASAAGLASSCTCALAWGWGDSGGPEAAVWEQVHAWVSYGECVGAGWVVEAVGCVPPQPSLCRMLQPWTHSFQPSTWGPLRECPTYHLGVLDLALGAARLPGKLGTESTIHSVAVQGDPRTAAPTLLDLAGQVGDEAVHLTEDRVAPCANATPAWAPTWSRLREGL